MRKELAVSAGARGPGGNASRAPGLNGVRTIMHMLGRYRRMRAEPVKPVRADRLGVSGVCHVRCVLNVRTQVRVNRQDWLANLNTLSGCLSRNLLSWLRL